MKKTFAAALFFSMAIAASAQNSAQQPPAWDSATLKTLAAIPVQEGGRVKPLLTQARFDLLKLSGRYWVEDASGKRLTPLEWWLNTVLFPEIAKEYKLFLVHNAEVLDAIGVPHEKKRDRYSYNHLLPGRDTLFQLGQQYAHIEAKDRTNVQTQLVNLASNVKSFEQLAASLDFADRAIPLGDSEILKNIFPGKTEVTVAELTAQAPAIGDALGQWHGAAPDMQSGEIAAVGKVFGQLESAVSDSRAPVLFPPPGTPAESEEWLTPGDMPIVIFQSDQPMPNHADALAQLASMRANRTDPSKVAAAVDQVANKIVALAKGRGEYSRIGMEVFYYQTNLLKIVQYLFFVGLIVVFALWFKPSSPWLWWSAITAIAVPTAVLIAAISVRCIIRGRPPVTTLYESILFITAVALIIALFAEYANRRRIALSIGAFLGLLGIFLANKYEMLEGVDTMPSLIAVLDTNFWLSTHVTTVTIGYAAGLVASAIAHVYLFGKAFGLRAQDNAFYAALNRMIYGVICFGLLFASVGTILGGIWANESWGRFWGWDPKENGALMIVLWGLAVLHARMGGYIRQLGVAVAAVFGGIIVAFSWFGVNLLGVGLHSYGFTSGIARALTIFYIVETVVLLVGAFVWLNEDEKTPAKQPAAGHPKETPGYASIGKP